MLIYILCTPVFFYSCNKSRLNLNQKPETFELDSSQKIKETITYNSENSEFSQINDYGILFGKIHDNKEWIIIRQFKNQGNNLFYLTVNINNLNTSIVKGDTITVQKIDFKEIINSSNSYYANLLNEVKTNNNFWKGLSFIDKDKYILTADLCPSKKSLDLDFINYLQKNSITPLYICISGKWMLNHKRDFEYLKSIKGIDIIWVNHSYNHRYIKNISNNQNFLLLPNTNVEDEVLSNEKLMIENGILPSPFFRFPGLIADENLFNQVISMGLIPLGSNAWLSKGEKIGKGSIILLHINGNDKIGLNIFHNFYQEKKINPTYIVN